jgi:2,4-dienoyl-CoA reductase-like NADH-dependent reductase (Old Yellow Enzyme family)
MYETINSPLNYGGLTLKNRIIFAPTTLTGSWSSPTCTETCW